jgi:hypothetical protein
MRDFELMQQLLAEIREARGQIDLAENLVYGSGRAEMRPRDKWLAWHKCHEAATNLLDVAEGLK